METDDDHATMRESFSLVQNILFIGYTNVLHAHAMETIVAYISLCLALLLETFRVWVNEYMTYPVCSL